MNMKDWIKKLNTFLQFNEETILKDGGKVNAVKKLSQPSEKKISKKNRK